MKLLIALGTAFFSADAAAGAGFTHLRLPAPVFGAFDPDAGAPAPMRPTRFLPDHNTVPLQLLDEILANRVMIYRATAASA